MAAKIPTYTQLIYLFRYVYRYFCTIDATAADALQLASVTNVESSRNGRKAKRSILMMIQIFLNDHLFFGERQNQRVYGRG